MNSKINKAPRLSIEEFKDLSNEAKKHSASRWFYAGDTGNYYTIVTAFVSLSLSGGTYYLVSKNDISISLPPFNFTRNKSTWLNLVPANVRYLK